MNTITDRGVEALTRLQRRRDQAEAARNQTEAAVYFAFRSHQNARAHGDVQAMLDTMEAYREACADHQEADAAYAEVQAEIDLLLGAGLDQARAEQAAA